MSSGKSNSTSKDYYGHMAWELCQGQIDSIYGLMLNNELVWPRAEKWDKKVYRKNTQVIYVDGNVYRASEKTALDPNGFPWVLYATPWAAGNYAVGTRKLYLGNVWEVVDANAVVAPPAVAPDPKLAVQLYTAVNNWLYVSTPQVWVGGAASNFWDINSIVAWEGRLWTNKLTGTKGEPGVSADWELFKVDRVDSPNPLPIVVEDVGTFYLYWGTADQVLDNVNEGVLGTLGHPPYKNKGVLVGKRILFGTMRTQPPEPVVLAVRNPVQALIVGASSLLDADWQANPWCILAELFTHKVIALGLPLALFRAAGWQAEADRCALDPGFHYISPRYTSLMRIRELVADLMSYPDAFVFLNALGLIDAGHWPHGDAAPAFDGTNTVDRDALTAEPKWPSDLWGGTSNSVEVTFSDWVAAFKSRPVFANSLFNMSVLNRLQMKKFDRPHIIREAQAIRWANEAQKIEQDVKLSGVDTLKAEKALAVRAGSIFRLTDDVLGVSKAQRCTRVTFSEPPTGTRKITHETERGVSPIPYSPTPQNPVEALGPPPARAGNFAVVQLPALLGPSSSIAVLSGRRNEVTTALEVWFKNLDTNSFEKLGTNHAFAVPGIFDFSVNQEVVLLGGDNTTGKIIDAGGGVAQGHTYPVGENGWWKIQVFYSAASGDLIGAGGDEIFAVDGDTIQGAGGSAPAFFPFGVGVEGVDFTADSIAGTITILPGGAIANGKAVNVKLWTKMAIRYDAVTPQVDLDSVMESLTADQIANGEVMMFAFRKDNPALFEIMSVRSISAWGVGVDGVSQVLMAQVYRGRFGTLVGGGDTGTYEWGSNANDVVFIIRRAGIEELIHYLFAGLQKNNGEMTLRLTTSSAWVDGDITDLYDPASNPEGLSEEFEYAWNNIFGPKVAWTLSQVNGADVANFNTAIAAADYVALGFSITDTNIDAVHGALVARKGDLEVSLWTSNFPATDFLSKNIQFNLPSGTWAVFMEMLDLAGNQTESQLTLGGNPQFIYVDTGTAESPMVYGYNSMDGYAVQLLFGLHPGPADGFGLKYAITNRNVSPVLGDWQTGGTYGVILSGRWRWGNNSNGTLPPIKKGSSGKSLWAYTTQTGKFDSAVTKWNF